jgi:hypothetical protein
MCCADLTYLTTIFTLTDTTNDNTATVSVLMEVIKYLHGNNTWNRNKRIANFTNRRDF